MTDQFAQALERILRARGGSSDCGGTVFTIVQYSPRTRR